MLYTITPLERIYTDRTEPLVISKQSQKESTTVEQSSFDVKHGKIYARKEGENYIIEGMQSTDMQDYLREEYAPGNNFPVDKG